MTSLKRAPECKPLGAIEMGREVAVAKIEPGLAVEPAERVERVEAFAFEAPAMLAIDDTGECIDDGVNVGRDVETIKVLVVAGIDDDGHLARIDALDQAAEELSRTHPPRQRGDRGLERSG